LKKDPVELARKIYNYLKDHPDTSISRLHKDLGITRPTITRYLELLKWIQKKPRILERNGNRGARIFKVESADFIIDLSRSINKEDFRCPRCGVIISPDDQTETVYRVLETKIIAGSLEGLEILCKKCESKIHVILKSGTLQSDAKGTLWIQHYAVEPKSKMVIEKMRESLERLNEKIEEMLEIQRETGKEKNDNPDVRDIMTILSLPNYLRETAVTICKLGRATISEIAKENKTKEAVESRHLSQLVSMGYVRKEKDRNKIYFSVKD